MKDRSGGGHCAVKKTIVASSIGDLDGPMGKDIMKMLTPGMDPAKANITRVDVQRESVEVRLEQETKESLA